MTGRGQVRFEDIVKMHGEFSALKGVTFDIEPQNERLVRLTVTHEDLEHDPKMLASISGGWPQVLSNLKSFLETGRALPY